MHTVAAGSGAHAAAAARKSNFAPVSAAAVMTTTTATGAASSDAASSAGPLAAQPARRQKLDPPTPVLAVLMCRRPCTRTRAPASVCHFSSAVWGCCTCMHRLPVQCRATGPRRSTQVRRCDWEIPAGGRGAREPRANPHTRVAASRGCRCHRRRHRGRARRARTLLMMPWRTCAPS